MSFLDRFAYVRELRDQITRQRLEIIELKADAKKMIDCIASTKGVLQPFASRGNPESWGMVNRVSVSREIQDLERRHNTKGEEE